MKKTLLGAVLIILFIQANAQALIHNSPKTFYAHENLSTTLFSVNTHFSNEDSVRIIFYNNQDTLDFMYGNSFDDTRIDIYGGNYKLEQGIYNIKLISSLDTLSLDHALNILPPKTNHVRSLTMEMLPAKPLDTLSNLIIPHSADLNTSSDIAYFKNIEGDSIGIDSLIILGSSIFKIKFHVPDSAHGLYDFYYYNATDSLMFSENALEVKNPTRVQIDSISPSIVTNNYPNIDHIDIKVYGNNTHFTDTNFRFITQNRNLEFFNYKILSLYDSLIILKILFPLPAKGFYTGLNDIFYVYDDSDGLLSQFYELRLDFGGGIHEAVIGFKNLNAFPNPAHDMLYLKSPDFIKEDQVQISVFNLAGQNIYQKLWAGNNQYKISTSNWKPGVYFVYVQGRNAANVVKIVHK